MFASSRKAAHRHQNPRPHRVSLHVEHLEGRDVPSASATYVPGELLVSFKPGVSQAAINDFYADYGLSEREALDRYAREDTSRLKLVAVPADRTMAMVTVLESDSRVVYAEPNFLIENALQGATPPDPNFIGQYYLHNTGQFGNTPDADIDAPEAWKITTGSPDVLVAVFDSGVDYNHPDLAANIWTNPFEIAADGLDNDGNGYVDDIHGYDFANDDGDPMDDTSHGTGVAGVIGAAPFNEGTVGVAWRVGIVAVKFIGDDNTGTIRDAIQAVQYVNYLKNIQGQNILVANHSWGGVGFSVALNDALAGLDQPGMSPILHVCSAGNQGVNTDVTPNFPAAFTLDNIISVAATDYHDHYSDWAVFGNSDVISTNYGAASVDLAALGTGVLSTFPNNQYVQYIGSSFSAPQVAGAAALVWSAFPNLTAAQVKQRILDGVDPIGHIGDNYLKPTLTNGRLNVANALAGARAENDSKAPAAVGNVVVAATTFPTVTLTWTATGDDGTTGRAGFYDVRYSTAPITSKNWDTATRATGEPGPKAAGSAESFTVWGLDSGTTHYFVMKVRDNMGNESALSNVATGTITAATAIFSDRIENGANGWTASGLWHQSALRSYSPSTAWYYGVEATRTYDTGAVNAGALTSPKIDLKKAVHPVLIYKEWRQVEDFPLSGWYDTAQLQVSTGANKWESVSQSNLSTSIDPLNWQARVPVTPVIRSNFSTPQWVSRAIDLSAYAGKTIQLRFAFDTGDEFFNNFEGWYIDDVNVYEAPGAPAQFPGGVNAANSGTTGGGLGGGQGGTLGSMGGFGIGGQTAHNGTDLGLASSGALGIGGSTTSSGSFTGAAGPADAATWFMPPSAWALRGDYSGYGRQAEQNRMDLFEVLANENDHWIARDHGAGASAKAVPPDDPWALSGVYVGNLAALFTGLSNPEDGPGDLWSGWLKR